MLGTLFSFRGRINRLQFFLGLLGLIAAIVVPLVIAVVIGGSHPTAGAGVGALAIVGVTLLAVPVLGWIGLSLQARRFRDIGWNPAYVIPGLMVAGMIDRLIVIATPTAAFAPNQTQTFIGLAISLGAAGALLFLPGRADAGDAMAPAASWALPDDPALEPVEAAPIQAASLDAAPVRAASIPVPASASTFVSASAPPGRPNAAAATFGRRGL